MDSVAEPEIASRDDREGLERYPHPDATWRFLCVLGMADLESEMSSHRRSDFTVSMLLETERPQCSDTFIEWKRAYTPKEHAEMLDRKWMQEHERQRELDRRKFEKDLARQALVITAISALGSVGAVVVAIWKG